MQLHELLVAYCCCMIPIDFESVCFVDAAFCCHLLAGAPTTGPFRFVYPSIAHWTIRRAQPLPQSEIKSPPQRLGLTLAQLTLRTGASSSMVRWLLWVQQCDFRTFEIERIEANEAHAQAARRLRV